MSGNDYDIQDGSREENSPTAVNWFFYKKIFTPFLALLLAVLCIAGTLVIFPPADDTRAPVTDDMLYDAATIDAVTIEEDELFPLVCLTPEDGKTRWQDGKVLLSTANNTPEDYTAGKTAFLTGEVWTVSAGELADWCDGNKSSVTDWQRRIHQLVGVPLTSGYTHITAMWVSPEDVIRPAYSTDITEAAMQKVLQPDTPDDYRDWFEANIIWSYFDSRYPWTRLGYTYDWAENSGEYGLTEFLVREGAEVTIAFTDTIPDYIKRLEQEKNKK